MAESVVPRMIEAGLAQVIVGVALSTLIVAVARPWCNRPCRSA